MKIRINFMLFIMMLCVVLIPVLIKHEVKAASEDVTIDATTFPDSSFRAFVSQNYDTNEDGVLSVSERSVSEMKVVEKQITSLKGVEYFTGLTNLDCHNNLLTSLDVSKLTGLRYLICDSNQLTSLDISNNTKLQEISCRHNQLTFLDLSKNTWLNHLFCADNQLKSLNVNANTALYDIDCSGNQLTALDVSNNPKLIHFYCNNNQLSVLDLRGNTSIQILYCSYNELTTLKLNSSTTLRYLYCQNNQLSSLDLAGYKDLWEVYSSYNQLSSLDVSGCTALQTLFCKNNQLTSLNLSKNSALQDLVCSYNKLSSLDISDCPNLISAYVHGSHSGSGDSETISYYKDAFRLNIDRTTKVITNTNTYTVSYDANGGTGTPESQTKEENVSLTLSSSVPTKKYTIYYNANGGSVSPANKSVSCTFKNWNTAKNGSGTSYSPGGSYTANADATLYAQWSNPSAGQLAVPTRNGYEFQGWYTAASGGQKITSSSVISDNCTLYARWSDPYNLGDETYSFENYTDPDSRGHCFGMSATSGGYYNNLLSISLIGGNASSSLFNFGDTQKVREPICFYQGKQGSFSRKSIVAGGSIYLGEIDNIDSDWSAVVNYVKNHQFDGTGLLQIGFLKGFDGHAVNFLRYENVNGQDRIYAYDNNFPDQETYFYKDSNGNVREAPVQTFSGAIDCIALRDLRIYFNLVKDFDGTRVVYVDNEAAEIPGYSYSYMEGTISGGNYVMYEIPASAKQVTIVPKKNNADFVYLGTEYSFGNITDGTYGVLKLSSLDDNAGGSDVSFQIYQTSGWHKIDGKWYYFDYAGQPVTGWKKVGSAWYYMDNQGVMQTGWKQISGKWYYFASGGAMVTGWKQISGKWYYFTSNGAMVTGWKEISGKWYYFASGGVMQTGWKQISGKWYYFESGGAMVTGWKTLTGKTYYFKASGAMASDEWCGGYYLNKDGSWTYKYKARWVKNSKGWWYGDTSGWYAKNATITIDDKSYTFDANGYWVK